MSSDCSLFGGFIACVSFFLVSARFLLGHVEDLIVLEFLTSVGNRQKDSLSGSLEEFAFFELHYNTLKIRINLGLLTLTLKLLSLDIGDKERRD